MLSNRQFSICAALAIALWTIATLTARWMPGAFTDAMPGDVGFIACIPIGWLCVRLTRRLARVSGPQIASACLTVLAVAASIDGLALRFLPGLYAGDAQTCRLAAAWLLWGYGVSAFAALLVAGRRGAHVAGSTPDTAAYPQHYV